MHKRKKKKEIGNLPQRSHRNDGVPEGSGYRGEVRTVDVLLRVEHDGGEDDDGHGEGEHKKAKFGCAGLQGVTKNPEALGVPGELEDSEYAEYAQSYEGAGNVVVVSYTKTDIIGQYSDYVDDRHHRSRELATTWRGEKPEQVFGGEDHDTGGVEAEKYDLVSFAA